MSTFRGTTKEYPNISIDRFDGNNLRNRCFLLSHNHSDHTVGLFKDAFIYKLESSKDVRLYCSSVTRDLLLLDECIAVAIQRCPHIANAIVALELEESHIIAVPDPETGLVESKVTMTLLPAKHCPGSVMFLIEGDLGSILYTGDFRLDKKDFERMPQLKSGDSVKHLKSLYIDTTFCTPEALFIPSREDSNENAITVIDEWVSQSPHHIVHLKHAAGLGYEQLYRAISDHFGMKIHVSRKRFADYRKVGDVHTFTTPNPAVTQIHACKTMDAGCWKRANNRLPCGYSPPHRGDELHVRTVKVSTMAFVQHVGLEKCIKRHNDNFYRICYSFHPSYSELREVIMYLKPGRVFANAIPTHCTERQEVMLYGVGGGTRVEKGWELQIQDRLDHFLKLAHKARTPHNSQEVRPLGQLKIRRKRARQHSSQFSDDQSFDFMDDSPPKVSKKSTVSSVIKTENQDVKYELKKEDNKEKNTSKDELCDAKAFPTLFGNMSDDSDEENKPAAVSDLKPEPSQNEASAHDGSESLFSDVSDSEYLQEDLALLKRFSPAAGGSQGPLVGYCSDVTSDEEEEADQDMDQDDAASTTPESPQSNLQSTESTKGNNQALQNPELPLTSRLKRLSSDAHETFSDTYLPSSSKKPKKEQHLLKTEQSTSSDEDSPLNLVAKQRSPDIVDISEPEDDSDKELEEKFSGRKRRPSENYSDMLPIQLGGARNDQFAHAQPRSSHIRSSRESSLDATRHPGSTRSTRYASSELYGTHSKDRSHAVRGYHNLMTNIEKILKSPTRSSLSDDTDNTDVVIISTHKHQSSATHRKSSLATAAAAGDYKHKKYRKFKHQPSASLSKPPCQGSKATTQGSTSKTHQTHVKCESEREQWFDTGEDEQDCIDLTAEDDVNDSDVISDGSDIKQEQNDVTPDVNSSDSSVSATDDMQRSNDESSSERNNSSVQIYEVKQNGTVEVSDESYCSDGSVGSEKLMSGDGNISNDIEARDNRGHNIPSARKCKRHIKRRLKTRPGSRSYSSSSDDSAATYGDADWYMDVKIARSNPQQDKSHLTECSSHKSSSSSHGKVYSNHKSAGTDVIVLDDSSNCSASRPNSVCVSVQATDTSVSPLAHCSSQSVVQLPSPVPKSWANYSKRSKKNKNNVAQEPSKEVLDDKAGVVVSDIVENNNKSPSNSIGDSKFEV